MSEHLEIDRQVTGEYKHRKEGSSARVSTERPGSEGRDNRRTPDTEVAAASIAAEDERFDGLVNETGNPPRQPGLAGSRDEAARDR